MKKIILLVLASFICGSAAAQTDLMKKKVLIGEVKSDNFNFVVDTKSFLQAINKEFSDRFDHVEIKTGETGGERTDKFYYIEITSGKSGKKMLRWLTNKDGKLYLERKMGKNSFYRSYFISCTGAENCSPTLYTDKKEIYWICGDKPMCVTEEEAKRNPCMVETSIIVPD